MQWLIHRLYIKDGYDIDGCSWISVFKLLTLAFWLPSCFRQEGGWSAKLWACRHHKRLTRIFYITKLKPKRLRWSVPHGESFFYFSDKSIKNAPQGNKTSGTWISGSEPKQTAMSYRSLSGGHLAIKAATPLKIRLISKCTVRISSKDYNQQCGMKTIH